MAGNRVEELESKVRELEATVSGLTDELVEAKERLRTLEEHTELDLDDVIGGDDRGGDAAPGAGPTGGTAPETDGPATQEDVDEAVEHADPSVPVDGDDGDENGTENEEASAGAADAVEPTNETTFIDADEVDHGEEADEIGPEGGGSADGTNSGEPEGADEDSDSDDIIVA